MYRHVYILHHIMTPDWLATSQVHKPQKMGVCTHVCKHYDVFFIRNCPNCLNYHNSELGQSSCSYSELSQWVDLTDHAIVLT